MESRGFLRGCLDTSLPDPDFCKDVPPPGDISASIAWGLSMAYKTAHNGSDAGQFFREIQEFYHEKSTAHVASLKETPS